MRPSARNMGPFMALNKRPGGNSPPPIGSRPTMVNFPSRRRWLTSDSTATAQVGRNGLLPWRFRA